MKKISNWKNYRVRCELKDDKTGLNNVQLLIFVDDEVMFRTKKNTFYVKDYKYQSLKLNRFYLPTFYDVIQPKLTWENKKEKIRFMNFCSRFKRNICLKIQDDVRELFSNYGKQYRYNMSISTSVESNESY